MSLIKGRKPSPALVVAILALIVAMAGGAYAVTVPKKSVGPKQLKAGAVKTGKIADGAVTSGKIADGAVNTAKIQDGSVSREDQSSDQRTLWAAVRSDGTIADQSGGISVTALGGGGYVINFGQDVSGRALTATGINARVIADAILCNGGTGVGTNCSPDAPNDSQHVGVNTALAAVAPAVLTNLPFYVAALPK